MNLVCFAADDPVEKVVGLVYDSRCQSDPVRLTRHVRVYGVGVCPVSENKVTVLLSDGRVLLWSLVNPSPVQVCDLGHYFIT